MKINLNNSFGYTSGLLSEREGFGEVIVEEIIRLSTLEAVCLILLIDQHGMEKAIDIYNKDYKEVKR